VPSDRTDGLTIRFTPLDLSGEVPTRRPPERIRLDPRSDGRHDFHEGQWNGCKWLPRGHDVVIGLEIEGAVEGAAVLARPDGGASPTDALERHLRAALETVDNADTDTRFHLREALQLLDAVEGGL
jgi:hypothetical protein